MLRKLMPQEKLMLGHDNLFMAMRVVRSEMSSIVDELVGQVPGLRLHHHDGHFIRRPLSIGQLPATVKSIPEALAFGVSHIPCDFYGNYNFADIWRSDDLIVLHMNHSVCDGGFTVALFNVLGTRPPPAEPFYHSPQEVFAKQLAKAGRETQAGAIWSHGGREDFVEPVGVYPPHAGPEGLVTTTKAKVPVRALPFFDSKKGGLVDLTGHTWCAQLAAGIVHNYQVTGKLDLSRSSLATLVNLRGYAEKPCHPANLGNMFSFTVPTAGEVGLEERLGDICGRLRASMEAKLENGEAFRNLWHIGHEQARQPPPDTKVHMSLSACGRVACKWPILECDLDQTWIRYKWPVFLTTTWTSKPDTEEKLTVVLNNTPLFFSDRDAQRVHELIVEGLRVADMNSSLRQFLKTLEPKIDSLP
jgi:hypothetical protein